MKTTTLALQLNSPAFLGDASQSGVWRTPPIKALLREWWRIASAQGFGYDHKAMRETEGLLFGNAWLEPDEKRQSRFCKVE
jgi:CRISPR-associated protein Cmr1